MSIVLPFAEKFVVEEISRDILLPRSLATTGTCNSFRRPSGFNFAVEEPAMRIHNGFEELPE